MPIEIVETGALLAAVVQGRWPLAAIARAQHEARVAIDAALAGQGASGGPRLTVWRKPEGGMIDYAPGILVPDTFAATGVVTLFPLPRGRAAHLRHDGGYAGLPAAWQALFSACAARGREAVGPNWEIYREARGATPVTDLYAFLGD